MDLLCVVDNSTQYVCNFRECVLEVWYGTYLNTYLPITYGMERGTSRKAGLRLFFFQKFGRPFFSKNDEEKYQAEYIALVSSDITA